MISFIRIAIREREREWLYLFFNLFNRIYCSWVTSMTSGNIARHGRNAVDDDWWETADCVPWERIKFEKYGGWSFHGHAVWCSDMFEILITYKTSYRRQSIDINHSWNFLSRIQSLQEYIVTQVENSTPLWIHSVQKQRLLPWIAKLKRRQKESTLAAEMEESDKGIAGNRKQTFRFIERGIVGQRRCKYLIAAAPSMKQKQKRAEIRENESLHHPVLHFSRLTTDSFVILVSNRGLPRELRCIV